MTDDARVLLREALNHLCRKPNCDCTEGLLRARITAHLAAPAPETVTAYALWSNEMYIREVGQVGVLHGRLFDSPEATKAFYENSERYALKNGTLVKVTVETLPKEEK